MAIDRIGRQNSIAELLVLLFEIMNRPTYQMVQKKVHIAEKRHSFIHKSSNSNALFMHAFSFSITRDVGKFANLYIFKRLQNYLKRTYYEYHTRGKNVTPQGCQHSRIIRGSEDFGLNLPFSRFLKNSPELFS